MNTRSKGLAIWATTLVAGATFTSLVRGDTEVELEVVPGTTATVRVEMTLSSSFCGGTGTDEKTASVTGSAKAILSPSQPPWNEVLIDPMGIQFSEMTFNFQFSPCTAELLLTHLEIAPSYFLNAPMDNESVEFANEMFLGWGWMQATIGDIPWDSFHFGTVRESTLSGRLTGDATTATFDNLSIGPITGEVLPVLLPAGIDLIAYTITADLSGVLLTGPRIEIGNLCAATSIYTFSGCIAGPNGGALGFCSCLDTDGNGHIDLRDFAQFQNDAGQ